MLIPSINDYYLTTFASRFNNQIVQLYPQLKDVDIRITDDDMVNIPPYLKEIYEKGCKITDTPFCGKVNHAYLETTYNDIVRINDVASGLNEEEQYALLAHEVGHFVAYFTNANVSGQQEEIFADEIAMNLGFHESLRSALTFSKVIIIKLRDSTPEFFQCYRDKYNEDIKNIEERIARIN